MQKLHLVGFTADFDGLIFSTKRGAKSGNFVVPIDGRLLKQIAEAERQRDGGGAKVEEHRLNSPRLVRPESALTPREMQDRIRSGWSLDEVAAEAGVDDDWVRRFAAPVLAEVRRVVERARAAVYDKPRYGLSTLPLGAAVRRNVLERGVRVAEEDLDDAWSAYQLDESLWIVRFAYTSRGRLQEAEWLYDLDSEELSSRNRLAAQLGHVGRGTPRRAAPVSTVPKPPKKPTVTKSAPKKSTASKVIAKKTTATRVVAKKPGASKALAKRPTVRKVVAKKTTAKKVVAKKPGASKVVAKRPTVRKVVAKKTTAKKVVRKGPAGHPLAAAPVKKTAVRSPIRPTVVRPRTTTARSTARPMARAQAGRAPAAPRKKAASQPAKKPAKETSPVDVAVPPVRPATTPSQRVGPLAPVPAAVREALASPIGDELEPPLPGATEVDPMSGIARIDSRRTSRYVSGGPPRQPVFRDVPVAGGATTERAEPPAARRPRRSEPLRGR